MEEFDRWPSFDFCSISQTPALFYIVVDRLHRNLVYRLKTEICLEFNVKLIGNRTLVSLGITLAIAVVCGVSDVGYANPYLARPGEPVAKVRIGTCAVTGGFIHLYAALDNRLFDRYGINAEHVVVRGGSVAIAALAADEINFLYCNADANIVRIGAGADGKLVASPLIGLPYVVLARKDIKRPADLKGKSIGVTRPGDFPYRLAKEFLKKFGLSDKEVTLATVGGTPAERYTALVQDVFQATLIQPPLDARGKKDGFNVIYNLDDLGFPFIYSSLFTNSRTLKERPAVVQKVVAALAESVHFVERNPEPAMASVGKILRIKDADTLRSAYDAYAKNLINRRMTVPAKMVAETLEIAREDGAVLRRKPNEIFDNTFVDNLEKSGFMRELWGGVLPAEKKRP
jgi:ABC-type nitrate/sulfonate/bicarbonate transport system substrate-binding protein